MQILSFPNLMKRSENYDPNQIYQLKLNQYGPDIKIRAAEPKP